MRTGRVESFSDGVFAVAITLLVLDLRVPITDGSLVAALADEWPRFVAFLISFLVIGIVWVNHHTLLDSVRHVDRPLLFFNLGLLLSVVVIPFTTSLFAQYVTHPGSQATVAAQLFNGAQLLMGLGFQLCGGWVYYHQRLWREGTVRPTGAQRLRWSAGIPLYLVCIPIAFVSPVAVLAIDGAAAAFYIIDQFNIRTAL
jgi:uncharacterized membrane protein